MTPLNPVDRKAINDSLYVAYDSIYNAQTSFDLGDLRGVLASINIARRELEKAAMLTALALNPQITILDWPAA